MSVLGEPVKLVEERVAPVAFVRTGERCFIDFGLDAFGTLEVRLAVSEDVELSVVLGEKLSAPGHIDREPPGCVRCREFLLPLRAGREVHRLGVPTLERHLNPAAIRMPEAIGEVTPFRYCEILNAPEALTAEHVRQVAVRAPFDDAAAHFECSDDRLNAVWALCKYSIKATTFCGIYVDGDRERIPYEADAYINQLGHYATDADYRMARRTLDHLLDHPTWPTEWALHTIMMAWEDWLHTGDASLVERRYGLLKRHTLAELAREDGLISTTTGLVTDDLLCALKLPKLPKLRDIVDWPHGGFTGSEQGESDGYEMVDVNTVVNAFHACALRLMAGLSDAVGKPDDATAMRAQAAHVTDAINRVLFDDTRGVYVDGEGSAHASLHANMFPLAFGLVPESRRESVVAFVKSRGMACSVYGAQYLLEALYGCGEADAALDLMTADHDRGWLHMIDAGSTITWEAWDARYKGNLDWNHAWGAAPANILPRWLLGVRPVEPGWRRVVVQPRLGRLDWASGRIPTPHGPISVRAEREGGLEVELPEGIQRDQAH